MSASERRHCGGNDCLRDPCKCWCIRCYWTPGREETSLLGAPVVYEPLQGLDWFLQLLREKDCKVTATYVGSKLVEVKVALGEKMFLVTEEL